MSNPLLYLICQKQRKNRGVQIKKEDELCLTLNAGAPSSAKIASSNENYQVISSYKPQKEQLLFLNCSNPNSFLTALLFDSKYIPPRSRHIFPAILAG